MPDWQEFVRRQLGALDLAPDRLLEIEEEVAHHLGLAYQDELRRGTQPEEARRRVEILFRDGRLLESELSRKFSSAQAIIPESPAQSPHQHFAGWTRDFVVAVRRLRRAPCFSSSVILILALTLGGVAAVAGGIRALLWNPLPYPDPARLHLIWRATREHPKDQGDSSGPDYLRLKASHTAFTGIAAFYRLGMTLTGGREPQRLLAASVEPNLFSLLGVAPELGPGLPANDFSSAADGVVISHRLWQEQLGGNEAVVGRNLRFSDQSRRILGVMPAGFQFPDSGTDAWILLDPSLLQRPRYYFLSILGKAREGFSSEQIQESLASLAPEMERASSGEVTAFFHSRSLYELATEPVRLPLLILAAGVLLVWLCSCLNLAGLFSGRLYQRKQELAVRLALGGDHWKLFRLVALEAWLLSLGGALLGMLIAIWAQDFLGSLSANHQELLKTPLGVFLPSVTAILAFISGSLFSLIPLLRLRSLDIRRDLNTTRQASGMRPHGWLVGAQLAVSLVLAVATALVLGSIWRLLAVDPGFNPDRLLVATIVLPSQRYPEDAQQISFLSSLLAKLEARSQIESASAATMLPLDGDFWRYRVIRTDHPEDVGDRRLRADLRMVTPGYFSALGVVLVKGREFDSRDRSPARRAIVVNQSLADKFWPGEDPLGKQIEFQFCRPQPCSVVGVVGDVKQFGLMEPEQPAIYGNYLQKEDAGTNYFHLAVRSRSSDLSLAVDAMKQALWELDPNLPLAHLLPLEERIHDNLGARPLVGSLLALFTLMAGALTLLAIYSLVSLLVSGQRHEIAIRLTLGATRSQVLNSVLRRVALLCSWGLGVGIPIALGARRLVQGFLFRMDSRELWILPVMVLALGTIALFAAWIPARRVTRLDPAQTLRTE